MTTQTLFCMWRTFTQTVSWRRPLCVEKSFANTFARSNALFSIDSHKQIRIFQAREAKPRRTRRSPSAGNKSGMKGNWFCERHSQTRSLAHTGDNQEIYARARSLRVVFLQKIQNTFHLALGCTRGDIEFHPAGCNWGASVYVHVPPTHTRAPSRRVNIYR